jgi:tetratricopeptide (TPR) repeat protein
MTEAIGLLHRGERVRAEEVLTAAVRAARTRFGLRSVQYAQAQNDLGTLLLHLGQTARAVEAFREAVAVNLPDNRQATRDRLTYQTNLAEALARNGALDEAEKVLRKNLAGREAFYGRTHPGYAFGLEPLANVLLRQGKPKAALEAVEEVVSNFRRNRHPRIATALALRAEIYKAAEVDTPAFHDADDLPDDLIAELAGAVLERVDETHPEPGRRMLQDLLPLVRERLGTQHRLTLNVLTMIANLERFHGDVEARTAAIRQVIATQDELGERALALNSVLGLALALSEGGRTAEALETYEDAVRRSDEIGDPALTAQALRNYGLLLSELDRRPAADEKLRAALESARASGDRTMIGRCAIALGIFLQHDGQLDEARGLLAEALDLMDPAHPDAIVGRNHLNAIDTSGACGCGDISQAIAQAFRDFVWARLPEGLLDHLDVSLSEDNNFHVKVHLNREPTQDELEQLQRVITHAEHEFRERITKHR